MEAVVEAMPGLGVLRDAQKWVALAMPGYALAGAGAVVRCGAGCGRGGGALCCVALMLSLPDLAWGVGGKIASVRYPGDWSAVAAAINREPACGGSAAGRHHAPVRLVWSGAGARPAAALAAGRRADDR